MTNPTLREKIEEQLKDKILDITDEYKDIHREGGVQVYLGYPASLVDHIFQAVSEYIEELIGEDSYDETDAGIGYSHSLQRNILRKELREKLKEDLK